MNELMNVTEKTPIEIALKVDGEGYTTSSALHEFLEGDPKNYAKFCRDNIVENDFAVEGEDYIIIESGFESTENGGSVPKYDTQGRVKQEYKISASLAKRIAMKTKTPKGEEARKYFLACERGLVIATKKAENELALIKQNVETLIAENKKMKKELAGYKTQLIATSQKGDLCLEQAELLKKQTKYLHDRVPVWEGGNALRPSQEAERAKALADAVKNLVNILNDRSCIENEYSYKSMIGQLLKETDKRCEYRFKDVKKDYKDAYGTDNDYALDMVAFSEDYYDSYMATIQIKLNRIREDDEYAAREGNKMEKVEQMFEEARIRQEEKEQKKEEMRQSMIKQNELYEQAYQKEKDRPDFGTTFYDRVLISGHESYVERRQRLLENNGEDEKFDKTKLFKELGLID